MTIELTEQEITLLKPVIVSKAKEISGLLEDSKKGKKTLDGFTVRFSEETVNDLKSELEQFLKLYVKLDNCEATK